MSEHLRNISVFGIRQNEALSPNYTVVSFANVFVKGLEDVLSILPKY